VLALIDGDIVRYRTGFASNDVDERIALWRANETIEQILSAVGATEYRIYLSDNKDNNYRYKLYPQYKASREKQPKPVHHEALKDYLIQEWGAIVTPNQEADDALGIDQTDRLPPVVTDTGEIEYANYSRTVICSIDKDLLQVPGRHYNWVRNEHQTVTAAEGIRRFYVQCLTGDRTDDIPGIHRVGPKTAEKILGEASEESEYYQLVKTAWQNDEQFHLVAKLLWVRRYEGEIWQPPLQSTTPDTVVPSPSSSMTQLETGPSSEHGGQEKNGVPEHG
jgi:DNA polymerase-1